MEEEGVLVEEGEEGGVQRVIALEAESSPHCAHKEGLFSIMKLMTHIF